MKAINQLVNFLEKELAISDKAISLALQHCEQTPNFLPMTLWQYGLITLDQLAQIFDWLEEGGDWGMGRWGSVGREGGKIFSLSSHTSHPSHTSCLPNAQSPMTKRIDNTYDN
ncbi:DUF2949 domain-containing protein [Nostoc paludosum FACHB-159]|uniref:DUF2949 domain-containing protein n=1 Tax=Nostoc paludosum FACHB-159 TaxID=2692908 RepID=A0ABR8K4N1_9NOSO|nr:DUF2949 domain-containing protein [Nostoc sp. FACHB-857]MBD2733741.1 DUF2949 domain-containing protein [Nostoc paludosum FACHB-159]